MNYQIRTIVLMLTAVLLTTLGATTAAPQQNNPKPASAPSDTAAVKAADAFFQNQDWASASKAYQAIVARDPANRQAWYRLGYALHALGQYEAAIKAYEPLVTYGNPVVLYNLGCAYARLGDKEKAFEWLNRSIQAGFNQPQQLSADNDLVSLHDDARFKELQAKAQAIARPCDQVAYRQFDFWVGEWEVKAGGQLAGASSVQRILDGCVIFENWTGAGGGSGKSFNFFNSTLGKWQQTWVSNTGNVLELYGEFKDGVLRYEGQRPTPSGNKILHRLTFSQLPEGRVRQLWEQSQDGGQTWGVAFDGEYIRKK